MNFVNTDDVFTKYIMNFFKYNEFCKYIINFVKVHEEFYKSI